MIDPQRLKQMEGAVASRLASVDKTRATYMHTGPMDVVVPEDLMRDVLRLIHQAQGVRHG